MISTIVVMLHGMNSGVPCSGRKTQTPCRLCACDKTCKSVQRRLDVRYHKRWKMSVLKTTHTWYMSLPFAGNIERFNFIWLDWKLRKFFETASFLSEKNLLRRFIVSNNFQIIQLKKKMSKWFFLVFLNRARKKRQCSFFISN